MPLTRFAMHAKGEQIHVTAWPMIPETHHLASRHYAFEGRCFVICVGTYLRLSDVPDDFELKDVLAGREEIVYGDADLDLIAGEQQFFDAAGHYNRPDLFAPSVDNRPRQPISWSDDNAEEAGRHTTPPEAQDGERREGRRPGTGRAPAPSACPRREVMVLTPRP